MKKMITLFLLLFIITGCSSSVTYDFGEKDIKSNIDIEFHQEEFKDYINSNMVHTEESLKTEDTTEEFIISKYNETSIIALKKDDKYEYYEGNKYEKNGDKYKYSYKYDFDYENFIDNHYLNECFDFYFVSEDDNFYHYNISGKFTCGNDEKMQLIVKSDSKTINSNSSNVKDEKHVWDIKTEDNKISFSISKENKIEEKQIVTTTHIIGLVLIVILIGLAFVFHKLTKKND